MPQLPLNLSHTFNTWFGLQWNWGQESGVFTWKARDLPVHLEAGYFKHKLIWCHYFASCAVRYEILTPTLSPTLLIHTCVVVSEWRYSFKRQMIWYLYLLFFIVVRCVLCRCLLPSRLVFRCPLLLSRYLDIRDNRLCWRPCFVQLSIHAPD